MRHSAMLLAVLCLNMSAKLTAETRISSTLYSMVEYLPLVEELALMFKINPYVVSNPMTNQYYEEFIKGYFVNYEYTYKGYTFDHNREYYCFWGSSYCFDMTSKYYSYRKRDKFDLRIAINGYTPFYAEYAKTGTVIMKDTAKGFNSPAWNNEAVDYEPKVRIVLKSR